MDGKQQTELKDAFNLLQSQGPRVIAHIKKLPLNDKLK